jgi:hypothetical protein
MASHTKIRKFTKTQYNVIADVFKTVNTVEREMIAEKRPSASPEMLEAYEIVAKMLATKFSKLDINFNRARFLNECGIEE